MKKIIFCFGGVCVSALLTGILLWRDHRGICLFVMMPFFLLFAGAGLFFSFREKSVMDFLLRDKKKIKEEKREVFWDEKEHEELKLIKKRMELSYLQYQINPHFLYNTLDSIRSRALSDGQSEIAEMTEILSRFFRYCINNSDTMVTVREELQHIQDYYYIQKYRFEEKLNMKVELEEEEINALYLPRMTLQPVVENAMIHGLERVAHKGEIYLRLFRTQEKLVIMVSDNGAGMSAEELTQINKKMESTYYEAGTKKGNRSGIALNNTNVRLKLIFGEGSGIHYRSMQGEGTDAMITLPAVDVFSRVKYEKPFQSFYGGVDKR